MISILKLIAIIRMMRIQLIMFCLISKKHEVKLVATNNTFYLKLSADAHDILLCVKEGEKLSTPKEEEEG